MPKISKVLKVEFTEPSDSVAVEGNDLTFDNHKIESKTGGLTEELTLNRKFAKTHVVKTQSHFSRKP